MLSYRHAFHAGNFADVLKHLIEVEVLSHFHRKDKPFVYIDTHAGAGMYSLDSPQAQKTAEHQQGISAIASLTWPHLVEYLTVVRALQTNDTQARLYPGSPSIAQHFLREQDRAFLFELHSTDFPLLAENMAGDRRIKFKQSDGFDGLLALLPPKIKRGLVLIDPSYEVKTDYQRVVTVLMAAYRKFATGTYALWYPVVERERVDLVEAELKASGIRNIQLFELGLKPDTQERGMTSAGMILINPPYTLKAKMAELLPKLSQHLAGKSGRWRCVELVGE